MARASKRGKPFAGWSVLSIQHQLGTQLAQTDAVMKLGADPSRVFYLPPAYTEHKVFEDAAATRHKIPRDNFFKHKFTLRQNHEQWRRQHVVDSVVKVVGTLAAQSPSDRLLVLDDGESFTRSLRPVLV